MTILRIIFDAGILSTWPSHFNLRDRRIPTRSTSGFRCCSRTAAPQSSSVPVPSIRTIIFAFHCLIFLLCFSANGQAYGSCPSVTEGAEAGREPRPSRPCRSEGWPSPCCAVIVTTASSCYQILYQYLLIATSGIDKCINTMVGGVLVTGCTRYGDWFSIPGTPGDHHQPYL
eukprot:COSAG05_NODE_217_length_13794_cov_5.734064_10_plen_172_part_00